MKKRITAFIVALSLLLSFPITPVYAAEGTSDIESIVRSTYSTFSAANNVESGSYHGTMQILNHALDGNGKALKLSEGDDFTAVILNSVVFKTAVVEGLTAAFEKLQETYADEMYINGGMEWYSDSYRYYLYDYDDQGTADTADDVRISTLTTNGDYTGSINSYDEAMCLVAGGTRSSIWLEKLRGDKENLTYRVKLQLYDKFDFVDGDGEYTGHDSGLAAAVNLLGALLALGGAIESFNWKMEVSFEVTIPNICTHSTASYRWEHEGTEFYSVAEGSGFSENALTPIYLQFDSETEPSAFYQTDKTVHLYHQLPWVLEFRMQGTNNFILGPDYDYTYGNPCIFKTSQHMVGGYLELV